MRIVQNYWDINSALRHVTRAQCRGSQVFMPDYCVAGGYAVVEITDTATTVDHAFKTGLEAVDVRFQMGEDADATSPYYSATDGLYHIREYVWPDMGQDHTIYQPVPRPIAL